MTVGALAFLVKRTNGFYDWTDDNRASVSPKQRKKSFTVSNEFSQAELDTEVYWGSPDPEEVVVGAAERIPDEEALRNLQNTAGRTMEKPIALPKAREHRRNTKLAEANKLLKKFADSLGTTEAAMHINLAKKALADSWEFITEEDNEIRVTIISLEGALQEKKWRDFTHDQVNIVIEILDDCIGGKLSDMKSVLKRLSILHKKGIDIYPSALEEYYVEEEEEI